MSRTCARVFTSTAAMLAIACTASAQVVQFEATWVRPGGITAAHATFDLDLTNFNANLNPTTGVQDSLSNLGITNLTITVTGSSGGAANGIWTTGDFDTAFLYTAMPIDPLIEWVGQPQGGGSLWGVGGWDANYLYNHDFSLFSPVPGVPIASGPYEFVLSTGQFLQLTSFHPVPMPGAVALLGLGGLAACRQRK